jgi:hypothetical protein
VIELLVRRTALLAVGLASLAFADVAEAYTVTSLDGRCLNGPGTLHWAFLSANSDGMPSVIAIDPSLSGPIHLRCGLDVTEELYFVGTPRVAIRVASSPMNVVTVQGAPAAHHVFHLLQVVGAPNSRALVVQDGHAVDLERSYFTRLETPPAPFANTGGAVLIADGTLNVWRTRFYRNQAGQWGGAIHLVNGALDVKESTFDLNQAGAGGAILAMGDIHHARIDESTFYGNSALTGGAIAMSASATGGMITVVNSTFTENSAVQVGGAIGVSNHLFPSSQALVAVLSSTFVCNRGLGTVAGDGPTGAIRNLFQVSNSIMAGCPGTTDPVCYGAPDPDWGGNYNVWTDTSCHGLGHLGSGSLPNTDPLVLPLANNGGFTMTHALDPASPAIGAGRVAICPPTDQRGVARTTCWIGSYEN